MDVNTFLSLLPISPALIVLVPGNAYIVSVLVAWLRDPIEAYLPQADASARLNNFWLRLANLVCQAVLLLVEATLTNAAFSMQTAASIFILALAGTFVAAFGYSQVINAKKSSDASIVPATADDEQGPEGGDQATPSAPLGPLSSSLTFPTLNVTTYPFTVDGGLGTLSTTAAQASASSAVPNVDPLTPPAPNGSAI